MRTAAEVRAYFLGNWREIVPEILVTAVRVSIAPADPNLVEIELLGQPGAVRHLLCLASASGEPRHVRSLLPRLRRLSSSTPGVWAGLLVPHMGAIGARLCREAGVGYMDCCGNAHLRFNNVMVHISGLRNRFTERKQIRTLFHDKATIPLRIFLDQPGSWLTTREIADRGGLSLGWVSQILQQMHCEGYIERQRGGGSRLRRPRRLLRDWLEEYAFEGNEVFPFQMRGSDCASALQRLRTVDAQLSDRYALTLSSAVHALQLRPRQRRLPYDIHIYLPDLNEDLEGTLEIWRRTLGLRPAGHGANCFLVKPSYRHAALFGAQASQGLRTVSDLQLYLDLFHSPAERSAAADRSLAARLPFELMPQR